MFAVEMQNITKHFGSFTANDQVTFRVRKGEIHALVGENGAGKSTLMKLLYGIDQPDAGEIRINGNTEVLKTPARAIKLGIGMVHQHFMLIPPLTVAENIILGNEPVDSLTLLDLPKAERLIKELSDSFHFNINPRDTIESLPVGVQQRVEILKLLYRKAEIIILDEPTAILTPQEVEDLFRILRELQQEQKTIIFISHKVNEVLAISDRITVLRKGKVVAELETTSTNGSELARAMVGKDLAGTMEKVHRTDTASLLRVEQISCQNSKNLPAVKNVSFEIRSGEIFGIAAVEGNGQSELIEVLTGLRERTAGRMFIGEHEQSPHHELPLGHIPEDRLKHGLVLDFTLEENFILGRQRESVFGSWYGLNTEAIESNARTLIEQFHVNPPNQKALGKELSGGNQQKVVLAREFSKNADVLIACHPARGLDVGAAEFVHQALLRERNDGKAVLLVSSDLTELLTLSDRVAVLYNGEIVKTFDAQNTSERELGLYMTGAQKATTTGIN